MPKMPPTFHPHGTTAAERNRAYDRDRDSTVRRQLRSSRWSKASKSHRASHPLCCYCELEGRVTAATLVDHFWPHKDDVDLFWDSRFWISSCDHCHSGMKQSVERAGVAALTELSIRLGLPERKGTPP